MAHIAETVRMVEEERDSLREDVKELESTVDGLSEAVTDLETERDATAEAMQDIARDLELLAEVPLQDLEESIGDLVTRLRGLAEDPETLFAKKAPEVRYYQAGRVHYRQRPGADMEMWSAGFQCWMRSAVQRIEEYGHEAAEITVDDLPAAARLG